MARPSTLLPYRQGQLDGLCGIYATINAIRLALGANGAQFSRDDWWELFHALLVVADDTVGAVDAAVNGINPAPLRKLLECAVGHMAEQHEIKLTTWPVLERRERPALPQVISKLKQMTSEPHQAVVMVYNGHRAHWSVLKKVGKTSLVLFDSSGYSRIAIANCRMSYDTPLRGKREHAINPKGMFCLRVTSA